MVKPLDKKQMIMNFSTPPSIDDLSVLANTIVQNLPEDIAQHINDIEIAVEDFPNAGLLEDLELEDEFDLLVFFHGGDTKKSNIVHKNGDHSELLNLFRRPILDMWCETEEDLNMLLTHLIISELGETFNFGEEDIRDMLNNLDFVDLHAA